MNLAKDRLDASGVVLVGFDNPAQLPGDFPEAIVTAIQLGINRHLQVIPA